MHITSVLRRCSIIHRPQWALWAFISLYVFLSITALATSDITMEKTVQSSHAMVVAAHPDAARAGAVILQAGGNAMDAVVATAFALAVVEPEASGLGGGGFLLYYDAASGCSSALNYRELAPRGATSTMYSLSGCGLSGYWDAPADTAAQTALRKYGGGAVAIPRMVAGLLHAHDEYGSMALADVLAPAIRLAEEGFEVSENLYKTVLNSYDVLLENDAMAAAFLNDWLPYEPGEMMCRPDLAQTFRILACEGVDMFYEGEMASAIVTGVAAAGGMLSLEDLSSVSVAMEPAISSSYNGWDLIGLAPPAGAVPIIESLNVLSWVNLAEMTPGSAEATHWIIEATKLAFADRRTYLGDPSYIDFAWDQLLSDDWASQQFARITAEHATLNPSPLMVDSGSTTQISIVDVDGNMVSLTQSINYFFGSRVFIPEMGILMNNTMSDFDPEPGNPNSIAPGKIPMSSMSPMFLLGGEDIRCVVGSPGGMRITSTLVQLSVHLIDWRLPLDDAVNAARFHSEGAQVYAESRIPESILEDLHELGHPIVTKGAFDLYFGGANVIWRTGNGDSVVLLGVADPRRAGHAAGY